MLRQTPYFQRMIALLFSYFCYRLTDKSAGLPSLTTQQPMNKLVRERVRAICENIISDGEGKYRALTYVYE